MYGFTENYVKVKTPYKKELENSLQNIELKTIDQDGIVTFDWVKEPVFI